MTSLEACNNPPRFFLIKSFELVSDANTASAQMEHLTDLAIFLATKPEMYLVMSIKYGDQFGKFSMSSFSVTCSSLSSIKSSRSSTCCSFLHLLLIVKIDVLSICTQFAETEVEISVLSKSLL
jgi:hypothetical protein